ncbi:EF-hand domain-containing protein [Lutimaribacter marinistellae]|uniref:EF-hand domain-containing protein n=1 Tax=Lutimaribacter marinistellae TaxID=1820329 RepID=A0ABV7TNH1_9RHOB
MKHAGFIAGIVLAAMAVTASGALAMGPGRQMMSFEELDTDGNGEITRAEMEGHRAARFQEADTDGDGKLSLDEMQAQARQRADVRAQRMMEHLDADKDGFLNPAEMPKHERAGKMFDRADRDGSGGISKAEFEEAQARMKDHRMKRHGNSAKE